MFCVLSRRKDLGYEISYVEILCHAAIAHTTIKRKKENEKDDVFSHKFEEFSKPVSTK